LRVALSSRGCRATSPGGGPTPNVRCVGSGVLVMAANPVLAMMALVPPLRQTVEDRVIPHQELDTAPVGRVCLVDSAVLEREDAAAGRRGRRPSMSRSGTRPRNSGRT